MLQVHCLSSTGEEDKEESEEEDDQEANENDDSVDFNFTDLNDDSDDCNNKSSNTRLSLPSDQGLFKQGFSSCLQLIKQISNKDTRNLFIL